VDQAWLTSASTPQPNTSQNSTQPKLILTAPNPGHKEMSLTISQMPTEYHDFKDPFIDPVPEAESLRGIRSWESGASERLTEAGKSGRYHRKLLKKMVSVPNFKNAAQAPVTGLRKRSTQEESGEELRKLVNESNEELAVVRNTRLLNQAWNDKEGERIAREYKREREREMAAMSIQEKVDRAYAEAKQKSSTDSNPPRVLRVVNQDPPSEPESGTKSAKKANKKKSAKFRQWIGRLSGSGSLGSRPSSPASERG
jgi:hypothetical protein